MARATSSRGKGGLGRKMGPLPLWAWLLVGAGGVLAGVYLRRRLAGAAAGSSAAGTTPGTPPDTSGAGAGAGGSGSVGASQAPAPSGLDPVTEQALADAQNALVSGFGSAVSGLLGAVSANTELSEQGLAAGLQAQQQSFDFLSAFFGGGGGATGAKGGQGTPQPQTTTTKTPTSSGPPPPATSSEAHYYLVNRRRLPLASQSPIGRVTGPGPVLTG